MTAHTITNAHRRLAEQWSATKFEALRAERDLVVTELYIEYGLIETQRLTGWTKPTIHKCVDDHNRRVLAAMRKAKKEKTP